MGPVPERIVSLSPTATEMLFAIGAGNQVVAVDEMSNYPDEALAKATALSGYTPNVEAIAAYEPDLVVHDGSTELGAQLDSLGIANWVGAAAMTFDDIYAQIEQLGAATGHANEAAVLVADMRAAIEAAVASVPKLAKPPRYYHELVENIVGMLKVQGGYLIGNDLRITDQFFMGPSLVRGFAPSGIGPRDARDPTNNALGGTTYFGGTAEVQFPIFGLPRELGMRGAVFADAGTLFGYKGKTNFAGISPAPVAAGYPTSISGIDSSEIRSAVGASLLWQSPLGPIRFDYAYPITKNRYDRTQYFRFSGGTSF
jgi:hypothetical protein